MSHIIPPPPPPPPPPVPSSSTISSRPQHLPVLHPSISASSPQLSNNSIKCRNMIAFIGDDYYDIIKQIIDLSNSLKDDIPLQQNIIFDAFIQSIQALSTKSGIYAAVIALLNKEEKLFTSALIEKIIFQFDTNFSNGKYDEATLLMRCLVGLMSSYVITPDGVFQLLEKLIDLRGADDFRGAPHAADYPVSIAALSLPWISSTMYEKYEDDVNRFILKISEYAEHRSNCWQQCTMQFMQSNSSMPFKLVDRLVEAADALKVMQQTGWRSKATFRFYQSAALKDLIGCSDAAVNATIELSAVDLKASDVVMNATPLGQLIWLDDGKELGFSSPPLDLHDRWLYESHILSIINAFKESVILCAKTLVTIQMDHERCDWILMQCIFSKMLQLPKYPSTDASYDCSFFYFRLIYELVEIRPSFLKLLEYILHSIIIHSNELDEECFELIVEFFAYWLSVKNCTWNFDYLINKLDEEEGVERSLRRTIERLLRLVYRENMIARLPESLHKYILPLEANCLWLNRQNAPFEFIMLGDMMKSNVVGEPLESTILEIRTFIITLIGKKRLLSLPHEKPSKMESSEDLSPQMKRRKQMDDEIKYESGEVSSIRGDDIEMDEEEGGLIYEYEETSNPWTYEETIQLFLKTLLCKGHKTLTHMNRMMENYGSLLRSFSPSALNESCKEEETPSLLTATDMSDSSYYGLIIRVIFEFWDNNLMRITTTIKSLVDLELLPYTSVFRFIIFDLPEVQQDTTLVCEVLHQIIENALLVKAFYEANYTIAHRRDARNLEELEVCQRNIDDASTAIQQMVLFLCASLMVKFESTVTSSSKYRRFLFKRIIWFARRYAKYLDIDECIETLTTEVSQELKTFVDELKQFKIFYTSNAAYSI